jgi:adenylate cyclase 1
VVLDGRWLVMMATPGYLTASNSFSFTFPQLLGEERFKAIDKIKTVGSTYMAAVGLMPDLRILDEDETTAGFYLSTLVEFVFAMREKLLNINENSYNNFMLRVGECTL